MFWHWVILRHHPITIVALSGVMRCCSCGAFMKRKATHHG